MSRKNLQIVILVGLVAFAIAYPVIESLDQWDPAGPASDSELEAIGMLTLAGAICLLTQLTTFLSVSVPPKTIPHLYFNSFRRNSSFCSTPDFTVSPPTALRI